MYNPIIANDGLDDTLPAPLQKLKDELERKSDALRSVGIGDDPVGELLFASRIGKVASVSSGIVDKVQHEALLRTVVGEEGEVPVAVETDDPTWRALLLGSDGSTEARLQRPQRHDDVFRKPQRAEGEPAQHADGTFIEHRGEDIETWTYKNGKLVAGRIVGPGPTGEIETFYCAGENADEITAAEYKGLAA